MLKIGFQYTPVDSMATCVTPLEESHAAISTNSRVVVPQWRTSCSTLPPALSRRTQASTLSLCTSKPAQHLRMISIGSSSGHLRGGIDNNVQSALRAYAQLQSWLRGDVQDRLRCGLQRLHRSSSFTHADRLPYFHRLGWRYATCMTAVALVIALRNEPVTREIPVAHVPLSPSIRTTHPPLDLSRRAQPQDLPELLDQPAP